MDPTALFRSLTIEVPTWGPDKGKVVAKIHFDGKASVHLKLPHETAEAVMGLAREAILRGVSESANDLIAELASTIPTPLTLTNHHNEPT